MTGQHYQQPPPPQYQQPPPQAYPPQYGPRYQHADIIDRFIALIVDGVIVGILSWLLVFIIGLIGLAIGGFFGWFVPMIIGGVLLALYSPIMESMPKGATVGKQIMKIRVVNEQYQPVGFGTAFLRNLSKMLWGTVIVFIIDVLLVISSDKGQHLGDSLANCYVVKEQPATHYQQPQQQYQQQPQQQPQYQQPPPQQPPQGQYPPPPPG